MLIFKTIHGSRLYGVENPDSDYDMKGVYLNSLHNLLFSSSSCNRDISSDLTTDTALFSLEHYAKLLMSGEVIAVEMLFAPLDKVTVLHKYWFEHIYEKRHTLVNVNSVLPFVRYARNQIQMYNKKSQKLETAIQLLDIIKSNPNVSFDELMTMFKTSEVIFFDTEKPVRYLAIAGKSFGETTKYSLWEDGIRNIISSFGSRTKSALDQTYDTKAYYHAYRICCEAIELVETRNITFPRPEAPYLRQIRSGNIAKDILEDVILEKFNYLDSISEGISDTTVGNKIKDCTTQIYTSWLHMT